MDCTDPEGLKVSEELSALMLKFPGCFRGLTGPDLNWVRKNTESVCQLMTNTVKKGARETSNLNWKQELEVPATTTPFAVSGHFKVGTDSSPKIYYVGRDFRDRFYGKIEDPCSAAMLDFYEFKDNPRRASVIPDMFTEKPDVKFSSIWFLIINSPKLLESYGSIRFCPRTEDGRLGTAIISWDKNCGWEIDCGE